MFIKIALALSVFGVFTGASSIKKHQDEALIQISTCSSMKTVWASMIKGEAGQFWRLMVIKEISEKLTELVQPFYMSPSDDLEAICTAIAGLPHEIKDRIVEYFEGVGVKELKMAIEKLQQNGWRPLSGESVDTGNFSLETSVKAYVSILQGIEDAASSSTNIDKKTWTALKRILLGYEGNGLDRWGWHQYAVKLINLTSSNTPQIAVSRYNGMISTPFSLDWTDPEALFPEIANLPAEKRAQVAEETKIYLKYAIPEMKGGSTLGASTINELMKYLQGIIDAASGKTYNDQRVNQGKR